MDNKVFKELLGLDDDLELDDKALEGLKEMLKNELNFGELDLPKLTEEQIKKIKEEEKFKEELQKMLLQKPKDPNYQVYIKQKHHTGHGLTQLCELSVSGDTEKILRLTEVFLPSKEDEVIRNRMDAYNRIKMPSLKNNLDKSVLEQRKRSTKADLKLAKEKARHQLSRYEKGGVFSSDANFLNNESINQSQIEFLNAKRYANFSSNIAKLSKKQSTKASKNPKIVSLKTLARRKKLTEPLQIENQEIQQITPEQNFDVQKQNQNSTKIELINVVHKSSIMQKVEQNLANIAKLIPNTHDPSEENKQIVLYEHIKKLKIQREKVHENDHPGILALLSFEERQLMKSRFAQGHHSHMAKQFPSGVQNLSETEKCCFEFVKSLNFENQYAIDGQPSRVKSQFVPNEPSTSGILGDYMGKHLSAPKKGQNDLKNSFLGDFINNHHTLIEGKHDDAEEYMIMSGSEDEDMAPPSSEDEAISFGSETSKRNKKKSFKHVKPKIQKTQQQVKNLKMAEAQNEIKKIEIVKSVEFYNKLERDNMIRDIMISRRFQKLGKQFKRTKYWGEVIGSDSRHQINRDFIKFVQCSAKVKPANKQSIFKVEAIKPDKAIPFKSKYGGITFSNAHPNNFKIDDIEEFEFVQKQRAFIYDPLHIKNSNQFKAFSSMVGFGSLNGESYKLQKTFDRNQAIQSLIQDIKLPDEQPAPTKLEHTPILQHVLQAINIKLEEIEPNEEMDSNKIDFTKPFLDPRKQKMQRMHNETLASVSDNFDLLTNQVRIKKMKEYIQKRNDEISRNQQNDKNKNQSTAYRPTNLPVPMPMQGQTKTDELMSSPENKNHHTLGSHDHDSEMEDVKDESPIKAKLPVELESKFEDDENRANSEASQEEALGADMIDSNVTQEASHAKCILDLTFTKFKWNLNEDFTRFHRPDIQNQFDKEKQLLKALKDSEDLLTMDNAANKSSTHISIDASGSLKFIHLTKEEKDAQNLIVSIPMQVIDRELIKRKNKKRGIINADEYFSNRFKLSVKEGKFCVFEHIDENPIYINNFGMVSKLYRFLYNDKTLPNEDFLPRSKNIKLQHMGPYGLQILKSANSKLPLLGNIDKSLFQGISVLSNKLYRAPVFYHKPRQTDFFCSFFQDKKGQKQIVLREIQDMYTVGQLEPIQPVYNPQSRNYQQYIKQHSKAYIIRFLQENNNRLDFREIQHLFSYLTDQMLKKFIKEIQVEVNRDQVCSSTRQLSDETIKNLITPEMICQYESALYGEAMLRLKGIESITNADKISYASNKYCSEQRDPERQRISKFIENEVLCTPWNLSQNFCTINQSGGMLMIRGVGDPSNNNGGFSFLKMPLKISNDSLKDSMKIRMDLNPAIQNPKSVTGTDADLRRLKKEDIFNKLVREMNYDVKDIQKLARWSMVGLLRQHSSNLQGGVGVDDKNKRYARGIRYTSKTQREVYHKQVDQLFKTQMVYLTGRKMLNDESDHEDPIKALNNPANTFQDTHGGDSDDEEKGIFNAPGQKKYIVEITDQEKMKDLIKETNDEHSPTFGRAFIDSGYAPQTGGIQTIQDIPNYKKLLLANVPLQNQTMQTGQQIGLINIGSNSGNNQQENHNSKNAESMLEEKLENREMTYKCRVLKKVIKSEDVDGLIERVEFNSDPKVIKKFIKRQQKCITKKFRARKTGIREKMLINQQAADKVEFKTPLAPVFNNGEHDTNNDGDSDKNVIQISMDEPAIDSAINLKKAVKNSKNKYLDLKKLGGSTDIDQLLQNQQQIISGELPPGSMQNFKTSQSLREGGSKYKGQKSARDNAITIPQMDNDRIMIPMNSQENAGGEFGNNLISFNINASPGKIQLFADGGDDEFMSDRDDDSYSEKPKKSKKAKRETSKPPLKQVAQKPKKSKGESKSNSKFMDSYLQEMEQTKRQNQLLSTSRRTKITGESMLNKIIEQIISKVQIKDPYNFFRYPVDKKLALGYYQTIKSPICLEEMNQKAKRQEYNEIDKFLADVALMRSNAEVFNGYHHDIAVLARNLEETAKEVAESSEMQEQIIIARDKIQFRN